MKVFSKLASKLMKLQNTGCSLPWWTLSPRPDTTCREQKLYIVDSPRPSNEKLRASNHSPGEPVVRQYQEWRQHFRKCFDDDGGSSVEATQALYSLEESY